MNPEETKEFIKLAINFHKCDENYYRDVIPNTEIKYDFFYSNINIFNLHYLIQYGKLDEQIVQYFLDDEIIDLEHLLTYQQLSDKQLRKYVLRKDALWDIILEYQMIPCQVLQTNKNKLDWKLVSENQFMDLEFLISNINNIVWSVLPFNIRMIKYINEGMITLFQQTDIWTHIGYSDIDIKTLLKYKHKFTEDTWDSIIEHHNIEGDELEKILLLKNNN